MTRHVLRGDVVVWRLVHWASMLEFTIEHMCHRTCQLHAANACPLHRNCSTVTDNLNRVVSQPPANGGHGGGNATADDVLDMQRRMLAWYDAKLKRPSSKVASAAP